MRTGRIGSHSAPVLSLALCAISSGKVWVAPLIAMIADRSCHSFLVTLAMARSAGNTPRFGDLKVREIKAVAADGYGDASSLGGF